jgi:multiple sugar transport system substrate-binding protein
MNKKLISLVCLASIAFSSLTGCSSTTTSGKVVNGKKVISISVLTEDRLLLTAIQQYETAHPDITINVKEYSPLPAAVKAAMTAQASPSTSGSSSSGSSTAGGGTTGEQRVRPTGQGFGSGAGAGQGFTGVDATTMEKYVTSINTELMTGKAEDIILLNNLPYENYASKNLLVDYNTLIAKDSSFNKDNYYTNVINALSINGKNIAMPVTFGISVLSANKSILDSKNITIDSKTWTWTDFENIAKQVSAGTVTDKVYALANMTETNLVTRMLSTSYSTFVDEKNKTAKFDSTQFADLLTVAKDMVDQGLVNTTTSSTGVKDAASRGNTVFNIQTVDSPVQFGSVKNMYGSSTSTTTTASYYSIPGTSGSLTFTSESLYGINSKSKYQTESWDFIKFLLSDSIQASRQLGGFPVNKNALNTILTDAVAQTASSSSSSSGNSFRRASLTQADSDLVKQFASSVNIYSGTNSQVMSIVQEEIPSFFSGQKTAQDVAKTIQNRVNTYLKE